MPIIALPQSSKEGFSLSNSIALWGRLLWNNDPTHRGGGKKCIFPLDKWDRSPCCGWRQNAMGYTPQMAIEWGLWWSTNEILDTVCSDNLSFSLYTYVYIHIHTYPHRKNLRFSSGRLQVPDHGESGDGERQLSGVLGRNARRGPKKVGLPSAKHTKKLWKFTIFNG